MNVITSAVLGNVRTLPKHLKRLEAESIEITREVVAEFKIAGNALLDRQGFEPPIQHTVERLLRLKNEGHQILPPDDHLNRGDPSGFWEVYFRDDITGFTIRSFMSVTA
jgi:hypothetical protein